METIRGIPSIVPASSYLNLSPDQETDSDHIDMKQQSLKTDDFARKRKN